MQKPPDTKYTPNMGVTMGWLPHLVDLPFLANASRFSGKSHRQPKDPSATGIPLKLDFKKAVSCRKIG